MDFNEIEFKGKGLERRKMEYGKLITTHIPVYPFSKHQPPFIINEEGFWSVDRKTIGQYTGIKDVNGDKMYGNDFCKNEEERYFKITWNQQQACWWLSPLVPEERYQNGDWVMSVLDNQQLGNGSYSRKDLTLVAELPEEYRDLGKNEN